jgi:DNA-binding NarL/FixJ family response regulator
MEAPMRVGLIADDDAYFRMAVSAILTRQFGFSGVLEAASLDEALECLSENPNVCAALFDLSMPGMRTPTHLRAVRECFPNARIAVISGSTSRHDILLALEAGVLDLLVQGKTNKEIALALRLGEGTVKIHMAAIFRYFGVNNRAAAAVAGARPYPNRKRSLLSGL